MLWKPHCLRQTMAWAFAMCEVDTPEVTFSPNFTKRFKLHRFLMCDVFFFHVCGTIHHFPDLVLSIEITRVRDFQAQEFFTPDLTQVLSLVSRDSSQDLSQQSVRVMRHSSRACTWVSKRLYRLIPSDWMPPPSPCVTGSGFHTGWPSPIPLGASRSLANSRLHSRRETPSPPQDQSSIL